MSPLIKVFATAIIALVVAGLCYGAWHAIVDGNYLANASFMTSSAMLLLIAAAIVLAIAGIRKIWARRGLTVLAASLMLGSCQYAKSNQQVVVSHDCGMSWERIAAGDAVPKGTMDPCYMKVVMPNYPMQGDSRFITNLKDHVRAAVHIDYDYSITDPLAFIKQAKYLGKANQHADSDEALDGAAFEGAENMVIDKRIRDVSKGMFLTQDIVDMDQADLENDLLLESNKVLEPFGVHLNFITLTFDLDQQTREAIDVTTAMKVYQSRGLQELGQQVMQARAGATKIVIQERPEAAAAE